VGRLWLADIGIPPPLLSDLDVDVEDLFAQSDLFEIGPS
jgi:hypothetical protein